MSATVTYIKDMSMGVSPPVVVGSWSSLHEGHVKEKLKSQPARIQHLGRTAQDFAAAFGLGEDDTHIGTSDAAGVPLVAIQGLNQKLEERNRALEQKLSARDAELQALQRRLDALEQRLPKE